MENLQKDMTKLGSVAVTALTNEPYKMQDYDAERTSSDGVSMSTGLDEQPAVDLERSRSSEIMEAIKRIDGLGVERGLYEPPSTNFRPPMQAEDQDGLRETSEEPPEDDEGRAMSEYVSRMERAENASLEGFRGGKFYPIKSLEGAGELNKTGQEIGYGMIIKEDWLTNDRSKWPIIDGQPTDIRRGLTKAQMDSFTRDKIAEIQENLKGIIPEWDSMKPSLKMYFTDFAYNAGEDAIRVKNPTAFKALQEGQPVDAMIATFDYWNVTQGGIKTAKHGLLKRRLNEYNATAKALGLPQATSYKWGSGRAKVHFEGEFKEGSKKYHNKNEVSFKSSNIKEAGVTEYTPTNGRFE